MLNKYACSIVLAAVLSVGFLGCESKESTPTGPGTTPEWQTVFFDDFNRSDGPVGSNYSVDIRSTSEGLSYTFSISNNKLKLSGGVMYAIRYVNEVYDGAIRVSVEFSTTPWSGHEEYGYGFAVAAKSRILDVDSGQQEAYFGAVSADKDLISISKITAADTLGLPPAIASKAFDVQENRSYLIELTVNREDLVLVVTDLSTGVADTLTAKDSGPLLTGGIVSINGIQGEGDMIYFDDFKIERCE